MANHYIRLEGNKVIKGFPDAFEQPQEGDILVAENAGRHFILLDVINPKLFSEEGIPLYEWDGQSVIERDITLDLASWQEEQDSLNRLKVHEEQKIESQNNALVEVSRSLVKSWIQEATISSEELINLVNLYPDYEIGKSYIIGDLIAHQNHLYEVIQAHTSQEDWKPDEVPSLYSLKTPEGVIAEWVQPTGSHNAYNIGDKVTFEGNTYESLIDGNVWSPTEYPQGWQLLN